MEDPLIQDIRDKASMDFAYTAVINSIRHQRSKEDIKNSLTEDPAPHYLHLWNRLSLLDRRKDTLIVLDLKRLVIPKASQKQS